MSKKVKLLDLNYTIHKCNSQRKDGWIIFKCPDCDYVRKLNLKTNEMQVEGNTDWSVLHKGIHFPIGMQPEKYSPN